MKYSTILELAGILALFSIVRAQECTPVPDALIKHVLGCASNLKPDQAIELFTKHSEDREIKCFAKCLYTELGWFQNGEFSVQAIRDSMNKVVPNNPLVNDLIALKEESARIGNAASGDDCDKSYEFFIINGRDELKKLRHDIFCPLTLPEKFRASFDKIFG